MSVLPYALLNLAVLHHRFGQLKHTEQVRHAMSMPHRWAASIATSLHTGSVPMHDTLQCRRMLSPLCSPTCCRSGPSPPHCI